MFGQLIDQAFDVLAEEVERLNSFELLRYRTEVLHIRAALRAAIADAEIVRRHYSSGPPDKELLTATLRAAERIEELLDRRLKNLAGDWRAALESEN